MLERPDGGNLLDTARDVLLKELLPHLPEAQRFHARMVANAMAVARREAVADPAPALAALRTAMGAPTGEADDLLRRLRTRDSRRCVRSRHGRPCPGRRGAAGADPVALRRQRAQGARQGGLGER